MANVLLSLGVKPGEPVCIYMPMVRRYSPLGREFTQSPTGRN